MSIWLKPVACWGRSAHASDMTDVEQTGQLTLEFLEDPSAFLAATEAHLAATRC